MSDTIIRAVTLPVVAPTTVTWQELNAALHVCWRLSTDLANWTVHRLYGLDVPNQAKMPPAIANWPGYQDAASHFAGWAGWVGATKSAGCVLRGVHRKYKQVRFEVMVKHDQRLLGYRYPFPFPFHNQQWARGTSYVKVDKLAGQWPAVTLPIPGLGRVTLRLRRGPEFARQLAMFKQLHEGAAKKGEAAVYCDRKGHLLVKLVGHFPRRERGPAENVCFLHTDPAALLVAEINGRKVTITNGDHLRRAHAIIRETADRHRRFLQRVAEDRKREVPMDRRQRANLDKMVEDRCAKQDARVDTAVGQIAAQVARFLERQRVGLVVYCDAAKTFLSEKFRWSDLKDRIRGHFEDGLGGKWVDRNTAHDGNQWSDEWLTDPKRLWAIALAGKRLVAAKSRKAGYSHPGVSTPSATSSS